MSTPLLVFLLICMVCVVVFALAFACFLFFIFVLPMAFFGAIFANSRPERVEKMISLANIQPGQRAADLGSGDGRLLIAMAKKGIEVHGYEINPFLVLLARKNIKKAGLSDKAFVHWKNFWNVDFSSFDIVVIYGISYIMETIEKKLQKELRPNSTIISNYFIFSHWQPQKKEDNVYVYVKKAP